MRAMYPDYPWESSRFAKPKQHPRGYWNDFNHHKEEIERLAKELGVKIVSLILLLFSSLHLLTCFLLFLHTVILLSLCLLVI